MQKAKAAAKLLKEQETIRLESERLKREKEEHAKQKELKRIEAMKVAAENKRILEEREKERALRARVDRLVVTK